jgi:hypothetical protein
MKPRIRNRFLAIAVGVVLTGWTGHWLYFSRYPSWNESVQLPDGRTVTVTQKREYQPGYGTHQSWLTFELPEVGVAITWNEKLYPVMLGAAGGKVYVVGRPRGFEQIGTYQNPKYMYVAFEWRGDKFERIPFLSVPESLRVKENVRWCFPGGEDKRVFDFRTNPAWCDDMDPKWPTPKIVDLNIRASEAMSWAAISRTRNLSQ